MQKETVKDNLWNAYSVIDLAAAIMLTILDYTRDSFYLIVPVLVLFFFYGIKANIAALFGFVKRYWLFIGTTMASCGYYWFINRSLDSVRFLLAMFFVILGGYLMVIRMEGDTETGYQKLWVILLAVIILGIVKMVGSDQGGYFQSYAVELGAVVILAAITVLYIADRKIQVAGLAATVFSCFLLLKRDALHLKNILAIKGIIPACWGNGRMTLLFGHGQLAAHYAVEEYSENTFATLLYDYGLITFLVYVLVFVFAVVLLIKSRDRLLRKQAILVCVMLAVSAIFTMQYWSNIIFLIWSGIGILLGRYDYVKRTDPAEAGKAEEHNYVVKSQKKTGKKSGKEVEEVIA